ncbi:MAG: aminodeoxychorismate synthase component I [Myxococcota bacterium]
MLACEPEVVFRGGLSALEAALAWQRSTSPAGGRSGWLAGALSYDLGRDFERIPDLAADDPEVPRVWLAGFRAIYRYCRTRGRAEVVGTDRHAVERLLGRIRDVQGERARQHSRARAPAPTPHLLPQAAGRERFLEGVRAIHRYIRAGDVYQVNLARRIDGRGLGDPAVAYSSLTERWPAPFAAFLDTGDLEVISNSPERLLRVRGTRVETCPIKGTRPRAQSPAEDRWQAKQLLASEKDRAEHLMIVDLERNDLGRVCRTGSVQVERLGALRSFPTVHHLVSSVQGELDDPSDLVGLLRATFPGGSITGAPKLRAMEIIESLEATRRGIYTGSLGWIDPAGGLDLSIAIRTVVRVGARWSLQVGGGIVADSLADDELAETDTKAAAFGEMLSLAGSAD